MNISASHGGGSKQASVRESESGAEKLRRVVRHLNHCRESAIDGFSAEQLLILVRAVWASGWDVWIDQLTEDQCRAALAKREVPEFLETTRGLVSLPSSLASSPAVLLWIHGDSADERTADDVEERSRAWGRVSLERLAGKRVG